MTQSAGESGHRGPTTIAGRYVLLDEIGRGGMATVHVGRLFGSGGFVRTVAIKRLIPELVKDPELVGMFLDEVRLSAKVRHPNVIATLDAVAADGELYLVMDHVLGESLASLLRRQRERGTTTPVRIATSLVASALHGLHAAHETRGPAGEPLGVVHRDVSPENIMVGADGVPRVLDFGVAKARGRLQATRDGRLKGKLAYMSPEQIHGHVSRRSDVYSASVVLWEALTGARFHTSDDPARTVDDALHRQVPPPSERRADLEEGVPWSRVDALVLRGMARDAEQRFATAREMALELEAVVEPASASEIGRWVAEVMGDDLTERARLLAELEQRPYRIAPPPSSPAEIPELRAPDPTLLLDAAPAVSASERRFSRPMRLALVVTLTASMAAVVAVHATRAPDPTPPAPPVVVPVLAAASSASPDEAPASARSEEDPPRVETTPPKPPASRPRRTFAAGTRANDCTPPYVIDATGSKRFKVHCL